MEWQNDKISFPVPLVQNRKNLLEDRALTTVLNAQTKKGVPGDMDFMKLLRREKIAF